MLADPDRASADLPGRELAEAAAHQAEAHRKINLTPQQWELLAKDLDTDIANDVLVDTVGWLTVRELAEANRQESAIYFINTRIYRVTPRKTK